MILEKIDHIRENLPGALVPEFDSLIKYMTLAPYDLAAKELEAESHLDEPDQERAFALLDNLVAALERYFMPLPSQERAFVTDLDQWTKTLKHMIEAERWDAIQVNMPLFSRVFHPGGKEICGLTRKACTKGDHRKYGKDACDYSYSSEPGTWYIACPVCDTPRMFCQMSPKANGRCGFHGGKQLMVRTGGRPALKAETAYGRQITGSLLERFKEFQDDPDFLSVMPEITLIRARLATNLADGAAIERSDIRKGIMTSVRAAYQALDRQDDRAVAKALESIRAYLDTAGEYANTWREVNNDVSVLLRATEAERRRIEGASQMLSRQEAALLVDETIQELYRILGRFASVAVEKFKAHLYRHNKDVAKEIAADLTRAKMSKRLARTFAEMLSESLTAAEDEIYKDEVRDEALLLIEGEIVDES